MEDAFEPFCAIFFGMSSIIEILKNHKNKKDKRIFGLVVQGGGFRSTYSGSALSVFAHHNLFDSFEHVIGSSGGAVNAAYFISNQTDKLDYEDEDLASKKFVNLFRSEKKIDIDFFVDYVLKEKAPIDLNLLKSAYSNLHIVVTNSKTGRKEVISDHDNFSLIYEEFRATCALPILYDREINIGDQYYVDGSVADLLPIDVAHKLGCTDIFVIMTEQIRNITFDKTHQRLVKHLIRKFARRYPKRLKNMLPTNEHILKSNLRRITRPWRNTNIYVLQPSDEEMLISLATNDKEKLHALSKLGINDAKAFLKSTV